MARKILLADDSVTAQNMGRKILADAGYEVIAVNNGSAALKKIAELKPDLVILDVYMPGYSGLEVCQRLKDSQETARIPVLLSVGKLEPFKPEEAQRVRADGYIVKPFEASELLSALSKLEDKVVPRAEPSKPGRFARAIAAAEASDSRGEAATEQSGWKNRIGFPHEKTEKTGPEEKVADEASIYNPMNRDLRTVVETAGEKAAHQQSEEKRQPAANATEAGGDVAALAPVGLPQDVTPEEVAAIAAAAAQIRMAEAALKDEPRVSDTQIIDTQISATTSQPIPELAPQDEPVTMAATAESLSAASAGASRWTAVSVALESEESTLSLEHEMQKAYAVFAAAEADSAPVASVPEAQAAPAENSSAPAMEAPVEAPVAAISIPEFESAPGPEPVLSAESTESEPAQVTQSEGAGSSFEPGIPAPVVEVAPAEVNAETSPTPEATAPYRQPATVAEFMSPVSDAEVAGLAGLVGLSAESQFAPEAEGTVANATTASSKPFTRIVPAADDELEHAGEPKLDSEAVKTTAAAWASWRQIRDTGKESPVTQTETREFEVPEPPPAETNARAVAAGAEQISQEASTAAPSANPADVASIVDSVLADLRPKLMAEISRKMAEKK